MQELILWICLKHFETSIPTSSWIIPVRYHCIYIFDFAGQITILWLTSNFFSHYVKVTWIRITVFKQSQIAIQPDSLGNIYIYDIHDIYMIRIWHLSPFFFYSANFLKIAISHMHLAAVSLRDGRCPGCGWVPMTAAVTCQTMSGFMGWCLGF